MPAHQVLVTDLSSLFFSTIYRLSLEADAGLVGRVDHSPVLAGGGREVALSLAVGFDSALGGMAVA